VRAFAVPSEGTETKNMGQEMMCRLELVPVRGEKNFKPNPHYLLGVIFKIPDERPHSFCMGVS